MVKAIKPVKYPSVAVVIPYYNGSAFIKRSVESVLNQTVPPNEFIIVNDGSSDKEAAFLHEMAKSYEFKVMDKPNGGQGSARNAGVAATTSEYICFLDQDDYYLEDHNEILLNGIPENARRFGWAYADLYEADGDGGVVTTAIVKHFGNHPKTSLHDLIRNDMHILPSASLISRRAFEDVGGFDEQFTGYEDDDLFMRLFRRGYTNTFISKPVTAWCINSSSTSYSLRMSRSRMRFFKKLVETFPDDWFKGRFFLRDYLIPRFHRSFVGDAMMSVIKDKRNKIELYNHYDELMEIAEEYVKIVLESDSVDLKTKWRLRVQMAILRTKSRKVVKGARAAVNIMRHLRAR
ncbi:MAG: glycosyltransferase family 2 protein [Mesorhizobium sp.]|uniref:glycosyltransferase family 2 protein n=1 Tax=Mesorhizobium sp. TaxID=1871066 RepID=UPI001222D870|nr:glycosyltransferase family A protein [Mesorhizobium sp.]TIT31282.1 MAG: glycosyltransferase family 2 protein [Mesorhizobium sp.]